MMAAKSIEVNSQPAALILWHSLLPEGEAAGCCIIAPHRFWGEQSNVPVTLLDLVLGRVRLDAE